MSKKDEGLCNCQSECFHCEEVINEGQNCVKFDDELFCDQNCIDEHLKQEFDHIEEYTENDKLRLCQGHLRLARVANTRLAAENDCFRRMARFMQKKCLASQRAKREFGVLLEECYHFLQNEEHRQPRLAAKIRGVLDK